MSDKKRKFWRNAAQNTFHLSPRVPGVPYFEFHPGDVIQAQDDAEEALLERTEMIVEHKEEVKEAPKEEPKKPSEAGKKKKE